VRSLLYVPGDDPGKLDKALSRGADGLLVDLAECSIRAEGSRGDGSRADGSLADGSKVRDEVAAWLRTVPPDAEVWVRINPGPIGHDDARALVGPGLRGLVIARTDSTTQLDALDHVLSTVEDENGLAHGSVGVAPTLESAAGLLGAASIARGARVVRLHLTEHTLRSELRVEVSPDERELLYARSQVVLAGAAAGLARPIGPSSKDIGDLTGLRASSLALRRLGFGARVCLHPSQLDVVNEVFGT
jgi:citrate lyase subunit beta / citryl-CoA lyase